jgi:hypothetical protein
VSIGGNDVSENIPFLIEAALSVAEVLGGEDALDEHHLRVQTIFGDGAIIQRVCRL